MISPAPSSPKARRKTTREDELIATLLLMIGGSQTTINLIDHALADLTVCPHARRALDEGANPRAVIEASLRKDCPVMNLPMRWALADIDLGEDVIIRAGEPILLNYGGHGRDDTVNPDADQFGPNRAEPQHLAFGLGIHRCPGSHLCHTRSRGRGDPVLRSLPRGTDHQ